MIYEKGMTLYNGIDCYISILDIDGDTARINVFSLVNRNTDIQETEMPLMAIEMGNFHSCSAVDFIRAYNIRYNQISLEKAMFSLINELCAYETDC